MLPLVLAVVNCVGHMEVTLRFECKSYKELFSRRRGLLNKVIEAEGPYSYVYDFVYDSNVRII